MENQKDRNKRFLEAAKELAESGKKIMDEQKEVQKICTEELEKLKE